MTMNNRYENEVVSVITPVFNAERYLKETILSVVNQTYKDIEIVLVDDCSTDSSAQIINELKGKYQNIVYFRQPKNSGAGVARNTALGIASGRYVAFLDADDIWKPEKTEKQLNLMKEMNSPFSYTAIEMIDANGDIIKGKRKVCTQVDYQYLLHNTVIATSTVIIDRNVLGDFRMPLRRGGQDYATWLKLLRDGTVAVGIDEALEQYRVAAGSLSSNKFKSIKQVWEIQTQEEKIKKTTAFWHVICFTFNAFKKYIF